MPVVQLVDVNHPRSTALATPFGTPAHLAAAIRAFDDIAGIRVSGEPCAEITMLVLAPIPRPQFREGGRFKERVHDAILRQRRSNVNDVASKRHLDCKALIGNAFSLGEGKEREALEETEGNPAVGFPLPGRVRAPIVQCRRA